MGKEEILSLFTESTTVCIGNPEETTNMSLESVSELRYKFNI